MLEPIKSEEIEIELLFDEPSHTYKRGDTGELFTSVTTVIEQYDEKFEKRYWAMWTALKNAGIKVKYKEENVSKNIILVNNIPMKLDTLYNNPLYNDLVGNTKQDWKRKTDASHVRGNKIHNYLEDTINESRGDIKAKDNNLIKPLREKAKSSKLVIFETKNDLDKTDLEETYPAIYVCLLGFIEQGCTLIAEKKIYTTKFMIAGMIDVLVIKGRQFAIVDWKSNKDKLHFQAGYYPKVLSGGKWVKGTVFKPTNYKLKRPLNNLPKCKGIKYSLQLSLYAFIMELWGYKLIPNGLIIFHIRPRRKPLLLNITYYKDDVARMLTHFKNKKNEEKENPKRKFGLRL